MKFLSNFLLSINKLHNEENIHSTFNLKANLQILKYDVKMMLICFYLNLNANNHIKI
jgi:hypothetical protein